MLNHSHTPGLRSQWENISSPYADPGTIKDFKNNLLLILYYIGGDNKQSIYYTCIFDIYSPTDENWSVDDITNYTLDHVYHIIGIVL